MSEVGSTPAIEAEIAAAERELEAMRRALAFVQRLRAGQPVPDDAALAASLRHDAERAAILVWWGAASEDEARAELRALHRLAAVEPFPDMDEAADAAFDEAFRRQRDYHSETADRMRLDAANILRYGGDTKEAVRRATVFARTRRPPPPPHLITAAVAEARLDRDGFDAPWRPR